MIVTSFRRRLPFSSEFVCVLCHHFHWDVVRGITGRIWFWKFTNGRCPGWRLSGFCQCSQVDLDGGSIEVLNVGMLCGTERNRVIVAL